MGQHAGWEGEGGGVPQQASYELLRPDELSHALSASPQQPPCPPPSPSGSQPAEMASLNRLNPNVNPIPYPSIASFIVVSGLLQPPCSNRACCPLSLYCILEVNKELKHSLYYHICCRCLGGL